MRLFTDNQSGSYGNKLFVLMILDYLNTIVQYLLMVKKSNNIVE